MRYRHGQAAGGSLRMLAGGTAAGTTLRCGSPRSLGHLRGAHPSGTQRLLGSGREPHVTGGSPVTARMARNVPF
jgi:hypothetical protein